MAIEFNALTWLTEKPEMPEKECIVLTATKFNEFWDYKLYEINIINDSMTNYYVLSDVDGEIEPWEDLTAQRFAIIESLQA